MHFNRILALDPSGSFYEGKGTTGWCLFDANTFTCLNTGSIFAKHHRSMEEYWDAVITLIETFVDSNTLIVCEDYLLYATKLTEQINSRMETPKLIGVIQHHCWKTQRPYYMQTAGEVKNRWNNEILAYKGYIVQQGRNWRPATGSYDTYTHHSLDAIRHAVHYATFRNKER